MYLGELVINSPPEYIGLLHGLTAITRILHTHQVKLESGNMTSSSSSHAQNALQNKLHFGCLCPFDTDLPVLPAPVFYYPMGQLVVFGNSQVVIEQRNKEYVIKDEKLKAYRDVVVQK